MKNPVVMALPFRPVSLDDFLQYAKSLARLIEEPVQDAQRLLAVAYGHDNLHELQRSMQRPGRPGPFEEDALSTYPPTVQGIEERGPRLLRLVAERKGIASPRLLSPRYGRVADLRLFDSPPVHRAARKWIFAALDILHESETMPSGQRGPHRGIEAYGQIERTAKGEGFVRFTSLGVAIRDALWDVFPPGCGTRPGAEFANERREQRERAMRILDAHPDCPWPLVEYIAHHAPVLGQGPWHSALWTSSLNDLNTNGQLKYVYPEITAGYKDEIGESARRLLPDVRRAVSMFEHLYNGVTRFPPQVFWPDNEQKDTDFDVSTWPELLYWGGRVAANAGEREYAITLLKRLRRFDGHNEQHWAGEPLSALILDEGPEAVLGCFKSDASRDRFRQKTTWECMALAASLYPVSPHLAGRHYMEAMLRSRSALALFNDDAPRLSAPAAYTPDSAPECMKEFMHLSAGFWKSNPDAVRFFRHMAGHPEVRSALLNWHRRMRDENIVFHRDPRLETLGKKAREAAVKAADSYAGIYGRIGPSGAVTDDGMPLWPYFPT